MKNSSKKSRAALLPLVLLTLITTKASLPLRPPVPIASQVYQRETPVSFFCIQFDMPIQDELEASPIFRKCVEKRSEVIMKRPVEAIVDKCHHASDPATKAKCEFMRTNQNFTIGMLVEGVQPVKDALLYCMGARYCRASEAVRRRAVYHARLKRPSPSGLHSAELSTARSCSNPISESPARRLVLFYVYIIISFVLYQLFALTFIGDISRTLRTVLPLQKHETKYNHYPLLRNPCHRELFSSSCLLAIVVLLQSLSLALRRREHSSGRR